VWSMPTGDCANEPALVRLGTGQPLLLWYWGHGSQSSMRRDKSSCLGPQVQRNDRATFHSVSACHALSPSSRLGWIKLGRVVREHPGRDFQRRLKSAAIYLTSACAPVTFHSRRVAFPPGTRFKPPALGSEQQVSKPGGSRMFGGFPHNSSFRSS